MLVVPVLDIDFRTEKSQTPSSIQSSPLQVNFYLGFIKYNVRIIVIHRWTMPSKFPPFLGGVKGNVIVRRRLQRVHSRSFCFRLPSAGNAVDSVSM